MKEREQIILSIVFLTMVRIDGITVVIPHQTRQTRILPKDEQDKK